MIRLPRPRLKSPVRRTSRHQQDEKTLSRGQVIVLFALSLTMLIGIMGLAIDLSFAWINELRIQKAADSAALAGAVYLPDQSGPATAASLALAVQNGYTNGVGSVVIDAHWSRAALASFGLLDRFFRYSPLHAHIHRKVASPSPDPTS